MKRLNRKVALSMTFILASNTLIYSQCGTDMSQYHPFMTKLDKTTEIQSFVPLKNVEIGLRTITVRDSTKKLSIKKDEMSQALSDLNKAFEPSGISFYYERNIIEEDYNFTYIKEDELIEDLVNRYREKDKIYIYLIDELESETLAGTNKKWSSLIYSTDPTHQYTNILFQKSRFNSTELIHQMGHVFGLFHTYETKWGRELVDGSNANDAGDFIPDTPAEGVGADVNGDNYNPHHNNFMNEINGKNCRFTPDQYKMIIKSYFNNRWYLK